MFLHDATRKTRTTCKISTFFEDLSFLNPRTEADLIWHLYLDIKFIKQIFSMAKNASQRKLKMSSGILQSLK